MGGHRGATHLLVHRAGPGRLVGAAGGEVGAALRAGCCRLVQPDRAGRTGPVHDRSFIGALPWGACWYATDDRPPGHVRRRPQGDTWWSAGRRSDGRAVIPREEPGSSQTVNPAPLGRPLQTPVARPSWWGGHPP